MNTAQLITLWYAGLLIAAILAANFLEEFLERLVFMEKVEKGLAQAKSGKTTEHSKIIERFRKKWSK